ncbi:MAG: hypothetical protein ACK4QW_10270, partial [Alphaproteobacteria bacterium]
MIVEWLEILAGVVGAIGVIAAFVLGYRAPRTTEPQFKLRIQGRPVADNTYPASLIATNPGDQPIILRALVVQNPDRGVYFVTDPTRRGGDELSDVLAIDLEVLPERAAEIDFYVGRGPRASRELAVDVEFSNIRTPSVVR